ncbi:cupin domain-containing protein [Microvirga sp. KLBC 81]|uniref:cupin domain-containing protein n=1 Tax=Microvirga sp. KLBC 81 TaxID=1862707 RepID=UPI001FE02723|nr:cupin domain-containing protein [Microvirga sp. KLBC 81]
MVRVAFEAGAIGAEHDHPHIQCSLVESGVFDITITGQTRRFTACDSFLVSSNARHGAVAVEAGVLVDVFTPIREDFAEP